MTSKREELIAKARAAIKSSDSIELVRAFECLAAEQSHTPTNDEREAPEAPIHYDSEQAFAWQSGREAGLRDARRPVQGEPTDANQVSDEVADAAQIAMHEFCFGDEGPIGRLSVARQGWKVAIAAALRAAFATEQGGENRG